MAKQNESDWYANVRASWQPKVFGRWPSNAELSTAHAFGKPGKQSLALAMAMRESGVTGSQIVQACGAPQNNHRVGLIRSKLFERVATPPDSLNHTVYKVTLTAKGKAAIDAKAKAGVDKAPAKVAKAPKVAKVKKAKAVKPEPVTVPEPVTEPVTMSTEIQA